MFSRNRETQIEEELYKLKYLQKSLFRNGNGYKKKELDYYKKAKRALGKGDERTATTYARQSIQYSDMALNSSAFACRVEIIESRARDSLQAGRLSDQMLTTVKLLTNYLDPVATLGKTGAFDKGFDDIVVSTNSIADAFDGAASPASGDDSRNAALLQMANEELGCDMGIFPTGNGAALSAAMKTVDVSGVPHF